MILKVVNGWKVDFRLGSTRIRKTLPSRKLAEDFLTVQKHKFIEGKFIPRRKREIVPFSRFADEYYRLHCSVNMRSPEKTVFYHLEHLKKHFGDKPLAVINQHDVEEWKAAFADKAQPATVNRQLTTLKACFQKAIQWDKLDVNPARLVKKLRENSRRDRFLTEQEIVSLYEVAGPRLRAFLTLALNSGMRKANMINLTWDDVDMKNGVIHVLKTKSGKSYDVPMNNALFNLFEGLRKEGRISGQVLDSANLRREFGEALQKAGIKGCTIHALRHSFASHLAMKGIDLYTISQLLGHSDIKMTQRYAHLAPNHKKIAVNMIGFGEQRAGVEAKSREGREIAYSVN